jgi:hypothetical protein
MRSSCIRKRIGDLAPADALEKPDRHNLGGPCVSVGQLLGSVSRSLLSGPQRLLASEAHDVVIGVRMDVHVPSLIAERLGR